MTFTRSRFALRAVLCTGLVTPCAVLATEPGAPVEQTAEAQSRPADSRVESGLQEVVVTAQKRKQSQQDVAIAVAAVSGDDLTKGGVQNVTDLVGVTTSVQVNVAAGMNAFSIRGLGSNDFATNFASPVAVHVDEVYVSKVFMTSLLMFDIDHVEVLKGPQGTLFGRNTTGGSINLYTRQPSSNLHVNGSVGRGNYDTYRGELGIGGPIGDNLKGRVAVFGVNQREGFYQNLVVGKRDGAERKYAVRGQLQWSGGPTDILISAHYGRDRSLMGGYELVGELTPQSVAAGKPVLCPEYLNGTVTGATPGCVRLDGANEGDNNPYTTNASQYIHEQDNTSLGGLARVQYDLGWATLTSLSGIDRFQRRLRESDAPLLGVTWNSRTLDYSEEVRLTSSGDRMWNYVLGAYYANDTFDSNDFLMIGKNTHPGTTSTYDGGVLSAFTQTSKALAAFFHNEIKVADRVTLIEGVRWSRERVTVNGGSDFGTGITPAVPPAIVARPTTVLARLASSSLLADGGRRTDQDVSFKSGVQWKPNIHSNSIDDLMAYATISTAFRSGGYNAEFVTTQSAFTSLAPETVTSYEVGMKSQMLHRLRLNGDVYHYDFRNGFIRVDQPGAALPVTANAANIDIWGAELDTQWLPVDRLILSAGAGWTDAKINNSITEGGINLENHTPVNTAKWTFNGKGEYQQPITAELAAFVTADANYRSAQFLDVLNQPISREGGYWIVNAQIGIEDKRQGWTVSAWVKNLTQTVYRTYIDDIQAFGFNLNIYGPPRTYGVTFGYNF